MSNEVANRVRGRHNRFRLPAHPPHCLRFATTVRPLRRRGEGKGNTEKKPGPCGPGCSLADTKSAITFQRGTAGCIAIATWEEQRPVAYSATEVCAASRMRTTRMAACQPCERRTRATADFQKFHCCAFATRKSRKHLDARDGFELFRIDEKRVEREVVDVAEQLHQPAVFLDQIIGQHRDAEAALAGAQQAEHVVDGEPRRARPCRRGPRRSASPICAGRSAPSSRAPAGGDGRDPRGCAACRSA